MRELLFTSPPVAADAVDAVDQPPESKLKMVRSTVFTSTGSTHTPLTH